MKTSQHGLSFFAVLWIVITAQAQPALTPDQALARFKVAPDYRVELFASEPLVRQPVTMTFDERGRMWVIQYLQYPNPAGLTPVQVDQYLRTKYDQVPEPPPRGPRGADRITILEDTDGDGRADKSKDFVTGLNLASALAIGHGGVFVGQAPYLLFYPDRDRDDVPDGEPEVLLKGFGMEDAHAVVNSLQWGPDGWLYGVQGSTVTANIRGVEFQQGIWRYHPRTREFELFAEGGGNTWGLDFDERGNALAGTNFGERVLLHQVQGAYYVKGFSKHGPLHNPYTFGYFEHAPHEGWHGGHVTCGGIVYQGGAFPPEMNGRYIAANLLSNAVYWHDVVPHGSTFKTKQGGELLSTDDVWFRPIDCLTGPDGNVYVADWYDVRANHVYPEDTWDKTNGRVWRIRAEAAEPVPDAAELHKQGLAERSTAELIERLSHPNAWYAREAIRLLSERQDAQAIEPLQALLFTAKDETLTLRALWALQGIRELHDELALRLLEHPQAAMRAWTVRLLGDRRVVSESAAGGLMQLAAIEQDASVRSQLACTAKRLPAGQALPIVEKLLSHSEDASDPFIPLLLWWAIEDKTISDREGVLDIIAKPEVWKLALTQQTIAERLMRRYAAEKSVVGYESCSRLWDLANDKVQERKLLAALEQELSARQPISIPRPLRAQVAALWKESASDPFVVRLAVKLGSEEAYRQALAWTADPSRPEQQRIEMIALISQRVNSNARQPLVELLRSKQSDAVRLAALNALDRFVDDELAALIIEDYASLPQPLQARAIEILAGRKSTSNQLLDAVERGQIAPEAVPVDQLRRIVAHGDAESIAAVERRWGRVRPATAGEKQATIVVLNRTLTEGSGDAARGREVYTKHCATCHSLFGQGEKIGPDLTSADRSNRNMLLLNIVDPSSTIRPEYVSQTLLLTDGRVLTGLVVANDAQQLTLADNKGQKLVIPRSEIEELKPADVSLMPEKLLESLSAEQLRDLFRYLQSKDPVAVR